MDLPQGGNSVEVMQAAGGGTAAQLALPGARLLYFA
jgi:hypothetical protein